MLNVSTFSSASSAPSSATRACRPPPAAGRAAGAACAPGSAAARASGGRPRSRGARRACGRSPSRAASSSRARSGGVPHRAGWRRGWFPLPRSPGRPSADRLAGRRSRRRLELHQEPDHAALKPERLLQVQYLLVEEHALLLPLDRRQLLGVLDLVDLGLQAALGVALLVE